MATKIIPVHKVKPGYDEMTLCKRRITEKWQDVPEPAEHLLCSTCRNGGDLTIASTGTIMGNGRHWQ